MGEKTSRRHQQESIPQIQTDLKHESSDLKEVTDGRSSTSKDPRATSDGLYVSSDQQQSSSDLECSDFVLHRLESIMNSYPDNIHGDMQSNIQ